jgi:hypothetical protein
MLFEFWNVVPQKMNGARLIAAFGKGVRVKDDQSKAAT